MKYITDNRKLHQYFNGTKKTPSDFLWADDLKSYIHYFSFIGVDDIVDFILINGLNKVEINEIFFKDEIFRQVLMTHDLTNYIHHLKEVKKRDSVFMETLSYIILEIRKMKLIEQINN